MKLTWPFRITIGSVAIAISGMFTVACGGIEYGGMTPEQAFGPKEAALVQAAAAGDLEKVRQLIAEGAHVNARGPEGTTPLVWVLADGNLAGAEALLKAGSDPNLKFAGQESAMSLAAAGNRPKVLELLLRHGGDPNLTGPQGRHLIMLALLAQQPKNMQLLLDHGADVNAHDPIDGRTAAVVAVGQGRFDLAVMLLEKGLDYNLPRLARAVETRLIPKDSPQQKWRAKLVDMLRKHGHAVRLPE
jgi:ankyrin repeat protein